MWKRLDSQDVGSEAATIQRMRNSSLVKCLRAENLPGLSVAPNSRMRGLEPRVVGDASMGGAKPYREERWTPIERECRRE